MHCTKIFWHNLITSKEIKNEKNMKAKVSQFEHTIRHVKKDHAFPYR